VPILFLRSWPIEGARKILETEVSLDSSAGARLLEDDLEPELDFRCQSEREYPGTHADADKETRCHRCASLARSRLIILEFDGSMIDHPWSQSSAWELTLAQVLTGRAYSNWILAIMPLSS